MYSFGPGRWTPAVKALIIANVVTFVVTSFAEPLVDVFGLRPAALFGRLAVWQPVTYMFVHAGAGHVLFNMLMLWMFGVELERIWGTVYFTKFYLVSGLGAGFTQVLLGILPFEFANQFYLPVTVGASGAIYGLLLAYALYFPHRPILMFFVFPVQAKYFVMILGGLALLFSLQGASGVAHTAHLGGLVAGYLYLKGMKGTRVHPLAELRYRWLRWRIDRARRRFDVYTGGRKSGGPRVH
jgi:membrane associated rhomboid family serine protease